MNEKKAKALRKKVYGKLSRKQVRTYITINRGPTIINHPESYRYKYQQLKREDNK